MDPRQFLRFLSRIEPLKTNTRHCYTAGGTHETVAAHAWRLSTMAMLLKETFPDIDMDHVTDMCLVHDFGEAITGDIPSFLKTARNVTTEDAAVDSLLSDLPGDTRARLTALFAEMNAGETPEARLWQVLDKLEAVIQHNESDLSTWIPREYDLNQTYAFEAASAYPFLKALREQMRQDTLEKIRAGTPATAEKSACCVHSLDELLHHRQSCRSYDPARPVQREQLVACLEAARLAPSASNRQPWHYYAVTEPAKRAQLAALAQPEGANAFAADCPAFIVAVEEPVEASERLKRLGNGRRYPLMDLGLSVSQLCLAASELGLSTCMLGLFDESGVKALLDIAPAQRVQLVICIGYAADATIRPKTRKPLDEIATFVD